MKRIIQHLLKPIGIVIGVILTIFVLTTLLITGLYKDKILRAGINELNKQLNVPISVKKMEFTFWRTFPYASIEFDSVYVLTAHARNVSGPGMGSIDTLLRAQTIYLSLNTLKLLKDIYKLQQVKIINGFINLSVDSLGNTNYQIFKTQTQTSKNHLNLNLNNVVLINTGFEYSNAKIDFHLKGMAEKLYVKGGVQPPRSWFRITSGMFLSDLTVNGIHYLKDKHVDLKSSVFALNNTFLIPISTLKVEKMSLSVKGNMAFDAKPYINFQASGRDLNIPGLLSVLPDVYRNKFSGYTSGGSVTLHITVAGRVGKGYAPDVLLNFRIHNGSVIEKKSGMQLKKVYLMGSYENTSESGTRDELKVDSFSAALGEGALSGRFTIRQLSQPNVNLHITSKVNLSDMKSFLHLDTVEILKGWVSSTLAVKGKLNKDSKMTLADLGLFHYNGTLQISKGAFKIRNSGYNFSNINGSLQIDSDLIFNDLNFNVLQNDFHLTGSLSNAIPYMLSKNKNAVLTADITSQNLDLSNYFVSNPDDSVKKPSYSRQLLFPENLILNVNLSIHNFTLHKFTARDVIGKLYYRPTIFSVKTISFNALSGNVSGNGLILQDMQKNFITKCQLDLSHVDIEKMFYTFNNFSQKMLSYKNLRGALNGQIDISSQWNNALVLNKDKLIVDGDITINNGELVNFSYLNGLSRFISLDELKNIRFKTLKNRITVENRRVNIPQMDIYSSAFNIKVSGVHYFDNHYNYKVKVLLSDILWGKAKHKKKKNEEFGVVEEDGLGKTTIPISITGYNNDYKISYDTRGAINIVRKSLEKQKYDLRRVFRDEFGWYKKDTTLHRYEKGESFRVNWAEADSTVDQKPVKSEKQVQKKKDPFQVEWDQ